MRRRRERWRRLLGQAREWARWLAEELERRGIRVEEIVLFGSVARGDFREDSDLDMIVVSQDWEGMSVTDRLGLLYRIWDKPVDATFVAVTREELERLLERSIVLRDARNYWVRVYP